MIDDPDNPLAGFSLSLLGDDDVQTVKQPTARVLKRQAKETVKAALKREKLAEIVTAPPAPGECLHVISNGHFDYFCFIPLILDWLGRADECYGSTWTMSRNNARDLLRFFDEGKIGRITLASGNYFLKRESAVAATILEGLRARGQRFRTWENHAKIILLSNAAQGQFFVVEGSANWTANPRTEQNILLNDRAVYDFHRGWMEEMFR